MATFKDSSLQYVGMRVVTRGNWVNGSHSGGVRLLDRVDELLRWPGDMLVRIVRSPFAGRTCSKPGVALQCLTAETVPAQIQDVGSSTLVHSNRRSSPTVPFHHCCRPRSSLCYRSRPRASRISWLPGQRSQTTHSETAPGQHQPTRTRMACRRGQRMRRLAD